MTTKTTESTKVGGFVGWVAGARTNVMLMLYFFAIVFVGLSIFFATKAFSSTTLTEEKKTETPEKKEFELPKDKDKDKAKEEKTTLHRPEYFPPMVWSALLALISGSLGTWTLSRSSRVLETANQNVHDARLTILLWGGGFGLLTALLGFILFYQWRESLENWLDRGQTKEAKWALLALAINFVGLLVMFLSLQPARQEERSSSALRRAVYGYNSILMGILLLIVLVTINVISYRKLPGRLDTTETKFYSLSDTSKQLLADLKEPTKAYLIYPEDAPLYGDLEQFLKNCQEQNNLFEPVFIDPSDRNRVRDLIERLKLPSSDRRVGVLLTIGTEEKQFSFISSNDLVDRESNPGDPEPRLVFAAESKVMTELSFLMEGKTKPVLYFTQGHGELDITGAQPGQGTAHDLRQHLNDRKFEVKTFKFELGTKPKVDDATAIVILGQDRPFNKEEVDWFKEYLKLDQIGAKAGGGKLLAFLPPYQDKNGTTVGKTGLEEIFQQIDVIPENEYVMSLVQTFGGISMQRGVDTIGGQELIQSRNPLTNKLRSADRLITYDFPDVRILQAGSNTRGRAQLFWQDFLITDPDVPFWHETNYGINTANVFNSLRKDPEERKRKRFGTGMSAVAVLGSEVGPPSSEKQSDIKPRFALFGSVKMISDEHLNQVRDKDKYLELVTGTLDWLRERPSSIGIKPREFKFYTLPEKASWSRMFFLPLALISLTIIGLGVGIWVVRRS